MTQPRLTHLTATADDWGLSQPKHPGENDRKRSLPAVATDLNARLKAICNRADSVKQARREMFEEFKLFARYGVPNPKAEQLVQTLITEAFAPHKR
jgi:hypothetical protein